MKLLKLFGWPVTLRFGDPLVMDRWRWLRSRLTAGAIRTFDAGCGNGCFSFAAAALGNKVLAGSYDEQPLAKARARASLFGLKDINFLAIDLTELNTRAAELGTFDQIICTECIEHMADDRGFVQDLAALLRPGGRLLLTTPEAFHHALRHEERLLTEPGGHVRWGYTAGQLEALFVNAGLQLEEVAYLSGWVSQRLTDLMRVKHERVAWALTFPLRILQLFDRAVTRLSGYPWMAIATVATKPRGGASE
jgi:2-polyprenyl-6-hydroxyphenyl methylase/3-demethylubiquinone-9 3-methyltransferase